VGDVEVGLDSAGSGEGPMADSYEHGDELLWEARSFLSREVTISFSRRTTTQWLTLFFTREVRLYHGSRLPSYPSLAWRLPFWTPMYVLHLASAPCGPQRTVLIN
jgi:hypothetical protein